MRTWRAFAIVLLTSCSSPAFGQSQPAVPGRLVVAVGALWTGSRTIGSADATETAPNGSRFRVFATDTTLAPSTGLEGRVGVRLTPTIEVELAAAYATPEVRTRISSDVEGASAIIATESMKQVALEGAVLLYLARWRLGEQALPFLTAGAGYLRDLHQGETLAETGRVYHVGAGLDYLLRRRATGSIKALGVRADARAVVRSGGFAFDDSNHAGPAFGALLFARF